MTSQTRLPPRHPFPIADGRGARYRGPCACGLSLAVLISALSSVVFAQEPEVITPVPSSLPSPPVVGLETPSPPPPMPSVEVPPKLLGRLVVLTTPTGAVEGTLVTITADQLIVEMYNGRSVTVDRAAILAVRRASPTPTPNAAPPVKEASPWGYWAGFSGGPEWGGRRGPITPAGAFGIDFGASFHFGYVGVGIKFTWFDGTGSFTQDTTGGVMSSGAPMAVGVYAEAGLTHGIFIPYEPTAAIELRPGIGYGYELVSSAVQGISNCIDCDGRSFDYSGGQYLRFQLGVYYSTHRAGATRYRVFMAQNGFFIGGTVSLQHFVFGSGQQLQEALMFGVVAGVGP